MDVWKRDKLYAEVWDAERPWGTRPCDRAAHRDPTVTRLAARTFMLLSRDLTASASQESLWLLPWILLGRLIVGPGFR
jgi:hypothetical protein